MDAINPLKKTFHEKLLEGFKIEEERKEEHLEK